MKGKSHWNLLENNELKTVKLYAKDFIDPVLCH